MVYQSYLIVNGVITLIETLEIGMSMELFGYQSIYLNGLSIILYVVRLVILHREFKELS